MKSNNNSSNNKHQVNVSFFYLCAQKYVCVCVCAYVYLYVQLSQHQNLFGYVEGDAAAGVNVSVGVATVLHFARIRWQRCQAQTYWICRHFLLCTSVSDREKACGFAVCQCVCVCLLCARQVAAHQTHTHIDTKTCIGVVHVHNAGKRQTRI